eukprot:CAMPEP_0179057494 /NCGR_PEP_ID=MMETSP0796-20121207/24363_1 /TAXON_ID=73915 /ORGANISM="Pyrodinium bahamense, Strain pbaha01" /LENGTH=820 /DNA_ID=CAMNT_0020754215 /DNA_START=103 /DNA_END=2565 /DNA_ORIENTATION=-
MAVPPKAAAEGGPVKAKPAPKLAMEGLKERLHGEFTIKGLPGVKKFVFLPHGEAADARCVKQVLKHWGLSEPNLVIQTNDNTNPSDSLVYQEALEELPDLQKLKEITKEEGEAHLVTVNDYMKSRLLQSFGAVVVAAHTTNSWIVSKGFWFANHNLIQEAVNATKAAPTILAVDNPENYISDWNPHKAKAETAVKMLLEGAKAWKFQTGDPVEIDFAPQEFIRESTWAPAATPHKKKEACNFVWGGAEYFIFCIDPHEFNDRSLGPSGWVMLGGFYKDTARSLNEALLGRQPCILIDNTGGETQELARLIAGLNEHSRKGSGGHKQPMASELRLASGELLDSALLGQHRREELTLHKEEVRHFVTKSSVLELIDLHCEIPWLFKERIVSVNPLEDSPDKMLDLLSRCFASVYMKTHEVGAGSADQDVILGAWRLHRQLVANANVHRRRADVVAIMATLLTFLASSIAIVIAYLESRSGHEMQHFLSSQWMWTLEKAGIVLPAVATFVSSVGVFTGWQEKWSGLFMASEQLVKAIYLFRMRVGPYSLHGEAEGASSTGSSSGARSENLSARMHVCRSHFAKVVQEIVDKVTQQDLNTDALDFDDEAAKQQVGEHVERHVYGVMQRALDEKDQEGQSGPKSPLLDPEGDHDEDDNFSVLSNMAYFELRVKPLLKKFSKEAPWLSAAFFTLSTLVLVCGTLATILASLQLTAWVPIALSASVIFQSLVAHYNLKTWLRGTTAAVGQLRALETKWQSLGAVDKRLMGTRSMLTDACESAALQAAAARAGAFAAPQGSQRESDKGNGGKEKASEERKLKALRVDK